MGRATRAASRTVLLASLLVGGQAVAQDAGTAPRIAFAPVVARIVDAVIVPGYIGLAAGAGRRSGSMDDLCARADADTLAAARADFALLVTAWSRVEMFRFGPARDDNRYERLFFWPDRRAIGLRQVEALLAEKNETATSVDGLRQKSVAVQGLLALEYVLFGDGSDTLAAGDTESFRCRYGRAIIGAIIKTAREIADGWTAEGGYAGIMRDAGPDNPVYRSHNEALQAIIGAAREQLIVVRDLKLGRSIGEMPEAAVPSRAPFWRSSLALDAIRTNIAAVLALLNSGGLGSILPEESEWLAGSLAFELGRADGALSAVQDTGEAWDVAVRDRKNHQQLAYSLIPLGGAIEILEHGFPDALGLMTGFSTLDGD
jgi:uncharacterized protein